MAKIVLSFVKFISSLGPYAGIVASLLILLESVLPFLPLCAFITLNFISFGTIKGFIISWIFTCLGCFLSYYLFKKGIKVFKRRNSKSLELLDKYLKYIQTLSLPSLTVLIAIPFTPAFIINIAAGISNMEFKKFFKAIVIGKIFMVYFWGFIGVGLIESIKSPIILIKVILMTLIAFVISKIVNDKLN